MPFGGNDDRRRATVADCAEHHVATRFLVSALAILGGLFFSGNRLGRRVLDVIAAVADADPRRPARALESLGTLLQSGPEAVPRA